MIKAIKQLIIQHINLIKYLVVNIKKEQTTTARLLIMIKILKEYFLFRIIQINQQIKRLVNMLDKDYRNEIKKQKQAQKTKKRLYDALKLLKYFNKKYVIGDRTEERQFWRDFYSLGTVRTEVFEKLNKEIDKL
jgi:hypothetical protein